MRSGVADFQHDETPEMEEKDEAWFLAQLSRVHPGVFTKGKDFIILCPFHADSNPSLGVDRTRGVFHCWGCKGEGGWNKLAEKLGMEKIRRKRAIPGSAEMKHDIVRDLRRMGVRTSKLQSDTDRPLVEPWGSESWRGFSASFLQELGCIYVVDLKHSVTRIGLPVRNADGSLLGYTCRAIEPEDAEPKYMPLAPDRITRIKQLPANRALFMIDRVMNEGYTKVVLVEGPVDALRFWQHGIPAVSILGVGNWTDLKISTLVGLGIEAALVLMDSDGPGVEAQDKIVTSLRGKMRVAGLRLPDGVKDPDLLSASQMVWFKKRLERA